MRRREVPRLDYPSNLRDAVIKLRRLEKISDLLVALDRLLQIRPKNFRTFGGVVLDDLFPMPFHAEEHAVILACLGVLIAVVHELKNFFLLAFGQRVELSIALRQFQSADKAFQVPRRIFGRALYALRHVVGFLFDKGRAARRLEVIINHQRRAEVIAARLKDLFDTFFKARQLQRRVLFNLFGQAVFGAVGNVQVELRQIIFVEGNLITAQEVHVKIFMAELAVRAVQPCGNFLQRLSNDSRASVITQGAGNRFSLRKEPRTNSFVLGVAIILANRAENFGAINPRAHYLDSPFQILRNVVAKSTYHLAGIFLAARLVPFVVDELIQFLAVDVEPVKARVLLNEGLR